MLVPGVVIPVEWYAIGDFGQASEHRCRLPLASKRRGLPFSDPEGSSEGRAALSQRAGFWLATRAVAS